MNSIPVQAPNDDRHAGYWLEVRLDKDEEELREALKVLSGIAIDRLCSKKDIKCQCKKCRTTKESLLEVANSLFYSPVVLA